MIADTPNIFPTMLKAITQQDFPVLSSQLSNKSDISPTNSVYSNPSLIESVYFEPENIDALSQMFLIEPHVQMLEEPEIDNLDPINMDLAPQYP